MHLETPVQEHPVDLVGAYATADGITRLQDQDVDPGVLEVAGAGEAGEPCSDDGDALGLGHPLNLGVDNPHGLRRPGLLRLMDDFKVCGFEIGELLGFGATGEVWAARELATGETVALKRLRPGAGPGAVEALGREARLLASLTTPYVVRLREVIGEGPETVLVLDHAAGGSLSALLRRRGSLSPGEVVTVVVPLAQALAAAHDRGIVHGDVSPSNVLFTADGMPLLSDLGVARLIGDERETEATAEYADPRLAGAAPDAGSDVWALGALAHHLLCGSPPHEGDTVADVLASGADPARAPLGLLAPTAPRPLVSAIEQALTPDLADRPSARALALAMQRAQTAEPVRLAGAGPAASASPAPVEAARAARRPVPPLEPAASGSAPSPAPSPSPSPSAARDVLGGAPPPRDLRQTHHVARPAAPEPPVQARRQILSPWALASVGVVAVLLAGGMAWAFLGGGTTPREALPPVESSITGTPSPLSSRSTATSSTPAIDAPSDLRTSTTPVPAPLDRRWTPVLDELDQQREAAYADADPARLLQVYATGFPAQEADAARLGELARAGMSAVGVRHDLQVVRVRESDEGRVALSVTDVLRSHRLVDASGATLEDRPGRGERNFVVVLVQEPAGWRIAAVKPA